MKRKLKKAPKTKIIKALRAIRRATKAQPETDQTLSLLFLASFALNHYEDHVDHWNSVDTEEARQALLDQGKKLLLAKVDQQLLDTVFNTVFSSILTDECIDPILFLFSSICLNYVGKDFGELYNSLNESGGGAYQTVDQNDYIVTLIDRAWPGLCVNVFNRTVMRTDQDTGELRPLTSNESDYPDLVLSEENRIGVKRSEAQSAVAYVAKQTEFNPAQDMILECVADNPNDFATAKESDEYLESLASTLFGTDSKLVAKGFAQALVCMVKFTFEPETSKPLMYCPTIIGEGGLGKSALLAALIPFKWRRYLHKVITVAPNKFYGDLTQISVGWLQELAELDRYLRGGFAEDFKAVLTTHVNNFRAPYARYSEDHIRYASFWGTSNKEDGVLTDSTSAHDRRILPIKVDNSRPIPWEVFDQGENALVWAAAYKSYKESKTYSGYLSELRSEWFEDLSELQKDFRVEDAFQERIEWELSIRNTVNASHILEDCFEILPADQQESQLKRVNGIIRTMHSTEWEERKLVVARGSKQRIRVWSRINPLNSSEFTANLYSFKAAGLTPVQRRYYLQADPFQLAVEPSDDFA